MDSFFFNKIAGAVLGSALIAFGINELGTILTEPTVPEARAYAIAPEGAGEEMAAAEGAAEEVADLSTLMASADVGAGEKVAKKCGACHTFDNGGGNRIGPNLWDIVNRDVASGEGFAYSSVLADMEGGWSYEALDAFIANPKEFAPGTKMVFRGISKPEQRAALLIYLRSLSDSPAELPN